MHYNYANLLPKCHNNQWDLWSWTGVGCGLTGELTQLGFDFPISDIEAWITCYSLHLLLDIHFVGVDTDSSLQQMFLDGSRTAANNK